MFNLPELDVDTIRRYEKEYVLTPWTAQKGLTPFVADWAKGNYFYDKDGKKYLDFSAQFVSSNLGHADERVVAVMADQAAKLPNVNSQFATAPKAELGRLLADITPGDMKKSFFTTGGAEANEAAIKLSWAVTGKRKIISRYRGYHGSTFGAMSLSAEFRNWAFEPAVPGMIHCLEPYCYRCPFGMNYPQCDLQCAKHVEDVVRREGGAKHVAAFIADPIIGPGGIIDPPDGYYQKIRDICDRYNMLMISDEVMTGFGRTGRWFGIEHWGVVPDIITMAKGITSGYIPLGATCMRESVANKFERLPYLHGHTYSGHALSMATAAACIMAYEADDLINRADKIGKYLKERLLELQDKHPCVGDVRGKGLFCGIELVKSRKTREPVHEAFAEPPQPPTAKNRILAKMLEEGVYVLAGAASVLMVTPPLTIKKEDIDFAIEVIDKALEIGDAEVVD